MVHELGIIIIIIVCRHFHIFFCPFRLLREISEECGEDQISSEDEEGGQGKMEQPNAGGGKRLVCTVCCKGRGTRLGGRA